MTISQKQLELATRRCYLTVQHALFALRENAGEEVRVKLEKLINETRENYNNGRQKTL